MLKCKTCIELRNRVEFLQEQNAKLLDRLVALADAKAYGAVCTTVEENGDFYGSADDEIYDYDEHGNRITIKKAQ